MKKLVSFAVVVMMLLGMFSFLSTVQADQIYYGGTYQLQYVENNGEITITGASAAESITIPATIGSKPVTAIGDKAFYWEPTLVSITIPEGVLTIGSEAFSRCYGLTSITLPNSVTSIGANAFSSCTNLTGATFGTGLTQIPANCFAGSNLISFALPENVVAIGNGAFNGCSRLSEVVWNNKIQEIGDGAFRYCRALTITQVPATVTYVGNAAFSYCSALTQFTLPEGVTEIGMNGFLECTALKTLALPNSLTRMGDYMLKGCTALEILTLGTGVTQIPYQMLEGCTKLQTLYYTGSQEQYKTLTVYEGNTILQTVNKVYALTPNPEDITEPVGKVAVSRDTATTQTATLSATDDIGISGYYFGTNATPVPSEFTMISSEEGVTDWETTITLSEEGTYYFVVQDLGGNRSAAKSFAMYKVTLDPNKGQCDLPYVLGREKTGMALPTAGREGYRFIGWAQTPQMSSSMSSMMITQSTTMYALYECNTMANILVSTATDTLENANNNQVYEGINLNEKVEIWYLLRDRTSLAYLNTYIEDQPYTATVTVENNLGEVVLEKAFQNEDLAHFTFSSSWMGTYTINLQVTGALEFEETKKMFVRPQLVAGADLVSIEKNEPHIGTVTVTVVGAQEGTYAIGAYTKSSWDARVLVGEVVNHQVTIALLPFQPNGNGELVVEYYKLTEEGERSSAVQTITIPIVIRQSKKEKSYDTVEWNNGVAITGCYELFGFPVRVGPDDKYYENSQAVVPGEINGKPVVAIESTAFAGRVDVASVTIPSGVTYIAKDAFKDCHKNLRIIGQKGSAAQTYAQANGYTFIVEETGEVITPTDAVIVGDVDEDGNINAKDALNVLKISVGKLDATKEQKAMADVNKDDAIDAKDALEILKYAVGKPSCLN